MTNPEPTLIATSVVRGSQQGESHGGVYLIDTHSGEIRQTIDWNTSDIDFTGRGWDRGLRGIAFHKNEVYIAASDELFVYEPDFRLKRSFRSPYLKHCHEIQVKDNYLFLTSTGFDSVLVFDLGKQAFTWAIHISRDSQRWVGKHYDPMDFNGPAPGNVWHLNSICVGDSGVYVCGLHTGCLLKIGSDFEPRVAVDLPEGVHNGQLFADGVLFNDTNVDHVRFVRRSGEESAFKIPTYDPEQLTFTGVDDSKVARQGFGRGLCAIDDRLIAAGSSPSTLSIYDIESKERLLMVNFSLDVRNAIHGLEVWPY